MRSSESYVTAFSHCCLSFHLPDNSFLTSYSAGSPVGRPPYPVAGQKRRQPSFDKGRPLPGDAPSDASDKNIVNNSENRENGVENSNNLEEACEGHPRSWEALSEPQRAALARRLVVDPTHRLVFCPAPLHASSAWLKVLLFLATANSSRRYLNPGKVPAVAATNRSNHVHLADLPPSRQADVLRTHRSFLVVRHPLTRLAAAYLQKFQQSNPSFAAAYGRYIVQHYRSGAGALADSDGTDVEFHEFVRYLADVEDQESMNEHWQPLGMLCRMCAVQYDRLVHFREMEAEGTAMLQQFGLGGQVLAVPPADRWEHVSGEVVKELYSSLSPAVLARLVQRYKADVQLLGYTSRV